MFGILASNVKLAVPFDDLAAGANFLYRASYFHWIENW
jgi:hypothetical protein